MAGLLLLIFFLLLLKATVILEYTEALTLTVRVLGIPFVLLPRRKKKVRLSDYSEAAMEKKRRKQAKKEQKASERKAEKPTEVPEGATPKSSLLDNLQLISQLLKIFFSRLSHHLRIRLTRLRLTVASPDAAQTALLFGAVNAAIANILEILHQATHLETTANTEICVLADFGSEKSRADIKIAFSLRVWHLLDILLRVAVHYLKHKTNPLKNSN